MAYPFGERLSPAGDHEPIVVEVNDTLVRTTVAGAVKYLKRREPSDTPVGQVFHDANLRWLREDTLDEPRRINGESDG